MHSDIFLNHVILSLLFGEGVQIRCAHFVCFNEYVCVYKKIFYKYILLNYYTNSIGDMFGTKQPLVWLYILKNTTGMGDILYMEKTIYQMILY